MASPTPNLNMTYALHGGAVNTWDSFLDANFDILDAAISGTVTFAGGTAGFGAAVSLSQTQANNRRVTITGLLTSNFTITFPAIGGLWVIDNQTTGNFFVLAKVNASAATPINCGQGVRTLISSNATDMYVADDSKLNLIPFAGNPNGSVAGTAALAATNTPPSVVWDYTDNLIYVCTTTGNAAGAVWAVPSSVVSRGFDMPDNLGITAIRTGGNLLNLAIVQSSGSNATTASPIIVPFQTLSGTNFTGLPTLVNITGALSMDTNALGASLGTSALVPFRIWFALFNNAGTAVPAMRVCSTATTINPVAEYGVASTVSITGAATSAGVWYTPNGTTLTSCAFRLIGYAEYASGLATPGTYLSNPTTTVLFGPGIKKPGDIVQTVYAISSSQTNVSGTTFVAATPTASITPTSAANLVSIIAVGGMAAVSGGNAVGQLFRTAGGAGGTGTAIGMIALVGSGSPGNPTTLFAFDAPATTSQQTYNPGIKNTSGGGNGAHWLDAGQAIAETGTIFVQEIMG